MTAPASRDLLLHLVHELGKHGTRAAHNLPPTGPLPTALVTLLVDDLYGSAARPAVARCLDAARAACRDPWLADRLAALALPVARIARLEARVRAGDTAAQREAAALALAVEAALRQHLLEMPTPEPP